jgi:hypothetical protein
MREVATEVTLSSIFKNRPAADPLVNPLVNIHTPWFKKPEFRPNVTWSSESALLSHEANVRDHADFFKTRVSLGVSSSAELVETLSSLPPSGRIRGSCRPSQGQGGGQGQR